MPRVLSELQHYLQSATEWFLHLPDRSSTGYRPTPLRAMAMQAGVAKRVFVDNGEMPPSDTFVRGVRQPQPYCLVVPKEPLRFPLQPRICNVILVPNEIRCSHAWPAGVNRNLMAKHITPKLDSAASEHIVWSEKLLDEFELLKKSATAVWNCSSNTARAVGKETLVLSTW